MAAIAEISSDWSRVVLEVTEPGFDTFVWSVPSDEINKLILEINASKLSLLAKAEARTEISRASHKIWCHRQEIYDRQARVRFWSVVGAFVVAVLAFIGHIIWG